LGAPAAALADDNDGEGNGKVKLVRWDLVQFGGPGGSVVFAGGTDEGKDSGTGDLVRLTGSGQAEPAEGEAAGGGTFVHLASNGTTERARGFYRVTGFKSFKKVGGTLVGIPLIDGIGELEDTTGGILTLNVLLAANSGATAEGLLTVECSLPGGSPGIEEGITLSVRAGGTDYRFTQHGGATLFHVLQGKED
jgi:hypothetical protein